MITSFCRSWTISAERLPSSGISHVRSSGLPWLHERLAPPGDLRFEPIQAGRRADEHPLPLRAAPVEVADALRNLDHAEGLSSPAKGPDPLRAGDPEGAAPVALHPGHGI